MAESTPEPKLATARHRAFAAYYGVDVAEGTSKRILFDILWSSIKRPGHEIEMATWFVYRVSREIGRGKDFAGITGPDHPIVKEIAAQLIANESIVNSMRRYEDGRQLIWFGKWTTPDGREVHGGSNATMAYKAAGQALRKHAPEVSRAASQQVSQYYVAPTPVRRSRSRPERPPSGCFGILIFPLVAVLHWFLS